jgi:hypothetical protein
MNLRRIFDGAITAYQADATNRPVQFAVRRVSRGAVSATARGEQLL